MSDFGRLLISLGFLLVVIGLAVLLFARFNVPLGRLPGDFSWKGSNWSISFPLMTSIILSIVISLILWAINHFCR